LASLIRIPYVTITDPRIRIRKIYLRIHNTCTEEPKLDLIHVEAGTESEEVLSYPVDPDPKEIFPVPTTLLQTDAKRRQILTRGEEIKLDLIHVEAGTESEDPVVPCGSGPERNISGSTNTCTDLIHVEAGTESEEVLSYPVDPDPKEIFLDPPTLVQAYAKCRILTRVSEGKN
jgi:hypothetical protein